MPFLPLLQTPIEQVALKLQDMGFERGWGDTVGRTRDTMHLLADIMQACDPETLQASLSLPERTVLTLQLMVTHEQAAAFMSTPSLMEFMCYYVAKQSFLEDRMH